MFVIALHFYTNLCHDYANKVKIYCIKDYITLVLKVPVWFSHHGNHTIALFIVHLLNVNYVCLSVYLFILLSVWIFIYLSLHLSIYLSIYLAIYPSAHLSIYSSIYLLTYLSIHLSICSLIYLFIYLSIGTNEGGEVEFGKAIFSDPTDIIIEGKSK